MIAEVTVGHANRLPSLPQAGLIGAWALRRMTCCCSSGRVIILSAPVRDIADRAGVGIGTVYRHFPRRPDLIAAVFRQELDACADAADTIAAEHPPFQALGLWMRHFVELAATKHGLAQALHSGDPAFEALPARREQRLRPAFRSLFAAAVASGEISSDVDADDVLNAAATLCGSVGSGDFEHAQRLVSAASLRLGAIRAE